MRWLAVRSFFRSALVVGLLFAAIGGGAYYWYQHILQAPGPHDEDSFLIVEAGNGHAVLRAKLSSTQVIHQSYHYDAVRLIAGASFTPKAGEYLLPTRASLAQIMQIINTGISYSRRLTVVEGMRSADVVKQLNKMHNLTGKIEGIPDEGSLMPETYFYTYGTSRAAVIRRMQQTQQMALAEAWISRDKSLPYKTPRDALIMASIIEKEAASGEERRLVAAVLVNRLKKSMRLQSDPTVVYKNEKTPDKARPITKQDLKTKTPWNTYVIKGLPLTPICNPGMDAILAALKPAKSDYLYFVSDGYGGLRFAKKLAAHNRNVRLYRKGEAALRRAESK